MFERTIPGKLVRKITVLPVRQITVYVRTASSAASASSGVLNPAAGFNAILPEWIMIHSLRSGSCQILASSPSGRQSTRYAVARPDEL